MEKQIAREDFYRLTSGGKSDLCIVCSCNRKTRTSRALCDRHAKRLWRARNPTKDAYNNVKNKARRRKKGFTLTYADFVSICEATGYIEHKGQRPEDMSLDRIDPNKGYDFDNLQILTVHQNSSKGARERWVTLPDGRRLRAYQVAVTTEDNLGLEGTEEEPPDWLSWPCGDATDSPPEQEDNHIPTDNEPF